TVEPTGTVIVFGSYPNTNDKIVALYSFGPICSTPGLSNGAWASTLSGSIVVCIPSGGFSPIATAMTPVIIKNKTSDAEPIASHIFSSFAIYSSAPFYRVKVLKYSNKKFQTRKQG